jgi:hypothetical protein
MDSQLVEGQQSCSFGSLVRAASQDKSVGGLASTSKGNFVGTLRTVSAGQEEPVIAGSPRSLNCPCSLRRQSGVGYEQVDTYG